MYNMCYGQMCLDTLPYAHALPCNHWNDGVWLCHCGNPEFVVTHVLHYYDTACHDLITINTFVPIIIFRHQKTCKPSKTKGCRAMPKFALTDATCDVRGVDWGWN